MSTKGSLYYVVQSLWSQRWGYRHTVF